MGSEVLQLQRQHPSLVGIVSSQLAGQRVAWGVAAPVQYPTDATAQAIGQHQPTAAVQIWPGDS